MTDSRAYTYEEIAELKERAETAERQNALLDAQVTAERKEAHAQQQRAIDAEVSVATMKRERDEALARSTAAANILWGFIDRAQAWVHDDSAGYDVACAILSDLAYGAGDVKEQEPHTP